MPAPRTMMSMMVYLRTDRGLLELYVKALDHGAPLFEFRAIEGVELFRRVAHRNAAQAGYAFGHLRQVGNVPNRFGQLVDDLRRSTLGSPDAVPGIQIHLGIAKLFECRDI